MMLSNFLMLLGKFEVLFLFVVFQEFQKHSWWEQLRIH